MIAVALTFAISTVLVDSLLMTVVLVLVGSMLGVFLWRIPTAQRCPE